MRSLGTPSAGQRITLGNAGGTARRERLNAHVSVCIVARGSSNAVDSDPAHELADRTEITHA
jgi:hypothetical protein